MLFLFVASDAFKLQEHKGQIAQLQQEVAVAQKNLRPARSNLD